MIFVENVKMFEGIAINIIDDNGNPLFEIYSTGMALGQVKVAKGIKYPRKDRIDENLKNAEITPVVHNGQLFITEEQLYDLMLEMKTEKVKPFRKWITSEVLPSIRKYGAYMTPDTIEKAICNPDFLIKLATELKNTQNYVKQLETKIEKDRPKIVFAEAVEVAKNSILIGDLAKIIKQNGFEIGQKRLFRWLRENGYLIKRKGNDYNMPTQYSMELGLFEISESVTNVDGNIFIHKTSKVTGKGQQYFVNKFIGN